MESYKIPSPDTRGALERTINRLELCKFAIAEAHYELEAPQDAESKADILIAVEALTLEAYDLLTTTRLYVWGSTDDEDED